MKLSPDRQAEYDAMGLPWWCDQSAGITSKGDEFETTIFTPETDSCEVMEFATLAANAYHELSQTIEELQAKVERLQNALKKIMKLDERNGKISHEFRIAEEAIKEDGEQP